MWSKEVIVTVLDAANVSLGPAPYTTTLQTAGLTLARDSSSSTSLPSAVLTLSPTSEGTKKNATTSLTDTIVVIIVSVSLALLVCAIIPLIIFYGHWRSTTENQNEEGANKAGRDYCEENADVSSTQAAMSLATLEKDAEAESSVQDATQYAAIYQALDPKTPE